MEAEVSSGKPWAYIALGAISWAFIGAATLFGMAVAGFSRFQRGEQDASD